MLQRYKFPQRRFLEENVQDSAERNNDLLRRSTATSYGVHAAYFEAGADIVETNTFSGTTIGMADYYL
jgi:5-methyltetrahydrofolate--homocysteine methyltransferase